MRQLAIAVLTIAAGSACSADVIMFDNSAGLPIWEANGRGFDPTVEAVVPEAPFTPRHVAYGAFLGGGSGTVGADGFATGDAILIAQSQTLITVPGGTPSQTETFRPAEVFTAGAVIGPGAGFANAFVPSGAAGAGVPNLPNGRINFLGQSPTIGFRVLLNGLPHYGYIELDYRVIPLFGQPGATIAGYLPIRWAYESVPNTPITVPAPPAGVLLGAAGVALLRRSRNVSQKKAQP